MKNGPLEGYYRILDGDAKPNYLLTKSIEANTTLSAADEDLWHEHDAALASPEKIGGKISLLDVKIELGRRMLRHCRLCERKCGTDRTSGKAGHCGVLESRISSEFLHMGEEPELVPSYTIFFSGCTFNCVYCQNWDISTNPSGGTAIEPRSLAEMIEKKVRAGPSLAVPRMFPSYARNVNWVGGDPTSNLPFVLEVLRECNANLAQVWNSNMYLTEDAMRLLEGVIDVYLTDFKYGNDKCALRLSGVKDYMRVVSRNHGIARDQCEVIVRHLVLPGHIECCTRPVLTWISDNLQSVKVNVMGQYRPENRARDFPELRRSIGVAEFEEAIEIASELGLDLCE